MGLDLSETLHQRPHREIETWLVGSVTMVWLSTEADDQSFLHCKDEHKQVTVNKYSLFRSNSLTAVWSPSPPTRPDTSRRMVSAYGYLPSRSEAE